MRCVPAMMTIVLLVGCGRESGQETARPVSPDASQGPVLAPDEAGTAPDGDPVPAPDEKVAAIAPPLPSSDEIDPLDQALADLPPIRTGPMSSNQSSPWNSELAAERQAQLSLPTVSDPLWTTLRLTRISIDERTQLFTARHPAAVRRLEGRSVTVRGYMLPLEPTPRTRHFLISPYTPVCFFHPPAEPNEVIEVRLSRPIEAGYHLVEVTGVLRLANDGEKGLFFVIPQGSARVVERILE